MIPVAGSQTTGDGSEGQNILGRIVPTQPLIARCQTSRNERNDLETENFVTHTLTAGGFDASEDGTGRGVPLVSVPAMVSNGDAHSGFRNEHGLVAFAQNQRNEVREMAIAGALASEPGMKQQTYLAIPILEAGARTGVSTTDVRAGSGIGIDGDPMYTLQAGKQHGVGMPLGVRRLTPHECERLMGWPDDHTRYGIVNGVVKEMADGPRYRMCGNGVVKNVAEWIASRLLRVDHAEA